jgi:hypothetical protein
MAKLSGAAKATIWVAAISALAGIAVPVINHILSKKQIETAAPTVSFSNWATRTGHHAKKVRTFGSGSFDLVVSPSKTPVSLEICINQRATNKRACSRQPEPHESGPVTFEVIANDDWHLTRGGPVTFIACAFRNEQRDSMIGCSDPHDEPAHQPKDPSKKADEDDD